MKNTLFPRLLLLAFLIVVGAFGCSKPDKDLDTKASSSDWRPLFDGVSFQGWTFDVLDGTAAEEIFRIEDGKLVVRGKDKSTAVIRTVRSYENYELEFEWRWPGEPGNSGCLIHCSSPRFMNVWPKSLEVQLYSGNAGDLIFIGETIEVPEEQVAKGYPESESWKERLRHNLTDDSEKAPGEWNHAHVLVRDAQVEVTINGELVNRGWDCSVTAGAICFQSEKSNLEFRAIRIREL